MGVLLSTYGSRGDVEPMVGLEVRSRALGADVRGSAPPDFAGLLARVAVPLVPVSRPLRPVVRGATPPSTADLPRRAIVERRASQELDGSRSGGLHSRTIEVLDQRGIAERFLAEGQAMQIQGFARIQLDISDLPTRHNYGLALWQSHIERTLAAWVSELGVAIAREREVTGFTQEEPVSTSSCATASRYGRTTSSGVMEDAV